MKGMGLEEEKDIQEEGKHEGGRRWLKWKNEGTMG